MPKHAPFSPIPPSDLDRVSGGASRVSSRSGAANEQITQMLTQVTSSIKDLASSRNSGGMDTTTMMMMMMMMGGSGSSGSSAQAAAAPVAASPAPTPPSINISVKSGA